MKLLEQMREDWNRRAREDANYYVAFAREKQDDEEFLATARAILPPFEAEFSRLPPTLKTGRRALEIGCGPGRLMIPMSEHFGEIHGVDISDEMASLARKKLASIAHAHVHVNSGADLRMFQDGYFDFVYSFVVFQHIPDKEVVVSYLRESQRVLKPGGILACQLRGASPLAIELQTDPETWTGCWFSESEIVTFASAQKFPLVAISGIETQYTFTVFRKATGRTETRPDRIVLKGVTAASSGERRIPARGRESAVSLWIEGLPQDASLADLPVYFGDRLRNPCFISPVSESGAGQLNARLPDGMQPGTVPVRLSYRGEPVGDALDVEIVPPAPRDPRILLVTDRLDLLSRNRIANDGIKVTIEDVENPEDVSIEVGGRRAESVLTFCSDPITSTYVFSFPVPPGTKKGAHRLNVRVGPRELVAVEIQIA